MAEGSPRNAGDTGRAGAGRHLRDQGGEAHKLCQSVDLGGTNLLITAQARGHPKGVREATPDHRLEPSCRVTPACNNIEIGNDASTLDKAGPKDRRTDRRLQP